MLSELIYNAASLEIIWNYTTKQTPKSLYEELNALKREKRFSTAVPEVQGFLALLHVHLYLVERYEQKDDDKFKIRIDDWCSLINDLKNHLDDDFSAAIERHLSNNPFTELSLTHTYRNLRNEAMQSMQNADIFMLACAHYEQYLHKRRDFAGWEESVVAAKIIGLIKTNYEKRTRTVPEEASTATVIRRIGAVTTLSQNIREAAPANAISQTAGQVEATVGAPQSTSRARTAIVSQAGGCTAPSQQETRKPRAYLTLLPGSTLSKDVLDWEHHL
jgi:hypothetical protein